MKKYYQPHYASMFTPHELDVVGAFDDTILATHGNDPTVRNYGAEELHDSPESALRWRIAQVSASPRLDYGNGRTKACVIGELTGAANRQGVTA
jgi:hypothetical protein